MGCDISILSKHNLNISNVETLAIDLSNRFGFTIEYGYHAHKEYNKLLENDLSQGYVSLGLIDKKPFVKKYKLTDEKYQKKQLYEKFGDTFFELKEYKYVEYGVQLTIEQKKKDLQIADYFLEIYSETSDYTCLTIHNEVVVNDLHHYYSRWWTFCETIQLRDYFDDDYFQNFRISVMKDTVLLGGEKAYFVNDQCEHLGGVGQGSENEYNWQELENYINSIESLEVISISKTVLDINYQLDVKNKKANTLAFFDDFEDLL